MAHKPKKPESVKRQTHLTLPDGSQVKWPTSNIPGVYFRGDSKSKPRWEIKLRWTDELGNRLSRTHAHFTVDLRAKLGTAQHLLTARHAAEAEAEKQWAKIGEAKKAQAPILDERSLTLARWCTDYLDELERSQLSEGHPHRPLTPILNKGWTQEASLLRTLLGQAKSGENREGFPEFMNLRIAEISPSFVLEVLKARMKGRGGKPASHSSIKKVIVQLAMVYNRAKTVWKYAVSNPFHDMEALLKDNGVIVQDSRDVTIDPHDFKLVMKEMRYAHIVTKAAIYFDLDSSCRRGEAIKLNWENIDWTGSVATAKLLNTKSTVDNPKDRTIPVIGKALVALRAMSLLQRYEDVMGVTVKERIWEGNFRDGQTQWDKLPRPTHEQWKEMKTPPQHGPVFRLERKRLRADSVSQAWGRARDKAAKLKPHIKSVRVHDLRHTGITKLVDMSELNELQIARIVGHSNLQTTNRYYHGNVKKMGETIKRNYKKSSASKLPANKDKLLEQLEAQAEFLTDAERLRFMAALTAKK